MSSFAACRMDNKGGAKPICLLEIVALRTSRHHWRAANADCAHAHNLHMSRDDDLK